MNDKPIYLDSKLNLSGKDFFSENEAAHYACVSLGHFQRSIARTGVQARYFLGKKVYRRDDLKQVMEALWLP